MKSVTQPTDAGQDYAAAHAAHYGSKDLRGALDLYRDVIATHPNTQEAGYSRSQIQNIVTSVVPKQALFDVQVDLAIAHCAHEDSSDPSRARGDLT